MLTLQLMATRSFRATVFLLLLCGCSTAVPEPKLPQDDLNLNLTPEAAPFRNQPKIEIPADAAVINHFLKGQLLLGEGDFDAALKEFEGASKANPDDAFLHFRLASLYLRKGDLKKALGEAEAAVKLDPKGVDNDLFRAGYFSLLGGR